MPTKKLIEVALPLEAINKAAAAEKSIRHGHPSTLHLWWARRPLAACRAVLFASIVDDPSSHPDRFPTEELQEKERIRLFGIIERMVPWANSNDPHVLKEVRDEIQKATNGNPPAVLDPFCGGGSIPLEAQRLGLEAHGSDLNPVAVLITKALIEIPPKFAGRPPVNPKDSANGLNGTWKGASGLAADVRYYGQWMRDEAQKRISHLYPKAKLPNGEEATVIAWIWARTVKCPNPACGAMMPLVRSWALSTKTGPNRAAWVEPKIERIAGEVPRVSFEVATGAKVPEDKTGGTVTRQGATCVCCEAQVGLSYVRAEGKAGGMSQRLMAIVAEGIRSRIYLSPTKEHEIVACDAKPEWKPESHLPQQGLGFRVQGYGMMQHADLFTSRQLAAVTTFCDLVGEAQKTIYSACSATNINQNSVMKLWGGGGESLSESGTGLKAYTQAVSVYLGFSISRFCDLNNSLCQWRSDPAKQHVGHLFARHAISMVWDYAEANPFCSAAGSWEKIMPFIPKFLETSPTTSRVGDVRQQNATEFCATRPLISTDPPYYDNIGYADLSDFFYVWLRKSLGDVFPDLLSTLLTPKAPELIADPSRHGGQDESRKFFEDGSLAAFKRMRQNAHPDYPVTVYYAFKQSETEDEIGTASTGWETMLEGLITAGFQVTGTWPMRSELANRMRGIDSNALASCIVLVCRPRAENAPSATRTQFLKELRRELPEALRTMQHGNIAPVDFAQSAIGPGIGVFSRYSQVTELDGSRLGVREALKIINKTLDEVLSEQEGDTDAETRWAIAWYSQNGWNEAAYGFAETLSTAKNTSVAGLVESGVIVSRVGKVRLLRRDELPADWTPALDKRLTVWEAMQHLIRALEQNGEGGAARLLSSLCAHNSELADRARDLSYRLYSLCERKRWASEALAYNSLVIAWPEIQRRSQEAPEITLTLDL